MKNHITKPGILLMMASIITAMNLTGFAMVRDDLRSISLSPDESASRAITTSNNASDTTAPIIDALDIVIPYGTALRPEEMGTITDDQDVSPKLEIVSVLEASANNSQNTTTAEGSTLAETASNASTVNPLEATTTVEPVEDTDSEDAAATRSSTTVTSETAEAATAAGTAGASTIDGTSESATTAGTVGSTANAASTEAVTTAATSEASTTSATAGTTAADPGYLFSTPGQYNVVLKGTDKSGNESTKTITVTVTDNVPPIFSGLSEGFSLTDKDKNAPDYLAGITATDEIDGDITTNIKVDDSQVQYGKAGSYSVSYSVSDASGNEATSTAPVIIKDTTPPYVAVIGSSFNLFVTDKKPDYAAFVTAIDAVDGDVKDSLSVDDSSVKYNKSGEYTATIRAKDKSGNTTEKAVKVTVTAGWRTQDGKKYYYSPQDGHLYHSWSHIDEKLYYFDPNDGHMLTGLQNIDGRQYLLDSKDGHMVTGWQTISGKKYYFSPDDGHMYHDWSHIKDNLYYFDPGDGHMLSGMQTIEGRQYLLDSKDGHMLTGWQTIESKKYYFSPDDGHMYHSWSNIKGEEYYFDPAKGHLLTGLLTIDGDQYLLDETDGHMVTGWQTIDGEKYYFSKNDGHMYHDWSTIDGTEYYFDKSDGHMYTGRRYVDGEEYNFGTSGAATKVAQTRSSGNYNDSSSKSLSSYSYIGNRNTRKFHRASCSSVSQMNEGNKVGFDSRSEAIEGGYDPCKRCKP